MKSIKTIFNILTLAARIILMAYLVVDAINGNYGRAIVYALMLIVFELQDIDSSIRKLNQEK